MTPVSMVTKPKNDPVKPDPAKKAPRNIGLTPEQLNARFPSLTRLTGSPGRASEVAWVATFRARPEALHALLADFIKQSSAQPGRIGQRPMPPEADVDFDALVYGEQSEEPLTVALPKLMRVSERAFCARIRMSRTQFQRLLRGEYHPDVYELRLIAGACGKPPAFFLEYRKAMAVAAFVSLIDERPGIATSLYRTYLDVHLPR